MDDTLGEDEDIPEVEGRGEVRQPLAHVSVHPQYRHLTSDSGPVTAPASVPDDIVMLGMGS